jgi:flagella basal body P-ring formation protein FlgA
LKYSTMLFAGLWSLGFATEPDAIQWVDTAMVDDTLIYVKDIAHLNITDSETAKSIGQIIVGQSAPPGFSRFVLLDDLIILHLKRISQDIDIKYNNVRVLVRTRGVEKKVSDFHDEIMDQIQKMVTWKPGEWSCVIENEQTSFKCFNAPVSVEIQGLKTRYPRGALRLEFIAKQSNKIYRVSLSCRMTVITDVLVSKNMIERGQPILINDCQLIKKDISRMGPVPLFSTQELKRVKAIRSIPAGTVLHSHLVSRIHDVQKGDNLSIIISRGHVNISVAATARENGFIGEKIWVQNQISNKLLRVVLTDTASAKLL